MQDNIKRVHHGWRPRRYLQTRITTILIATALVAVGLATYRATILNLYRQQESAARLTGLGAAVITEPTELKWLLERFNLPTAKIVEVKLQDEWLSRESMDVAITQLVPLKDLERLYLASSPVKDEHLTFLSKCSRLRRLSLSRTSISDKGMRYLARLVDLESLDIDQTLVTDAGVECLSELTSLMFLDLPIGVSDNGISKLRKLTRLKVLELSSSQVTAAGLAQLRAPLLSELRRRPDEPYFFLRPAGRIWCTWPNFLA
ncbi:MAG: hypothetical protein R3C05_22225 [Pirellulaceae bacterium]